MRKQAPPSATSSTIGKLFLCFETKPLLVTLLALTLLMLLWNFPPYFQDLSTTTRPCSATPLASVAVSVASTSLLSTNASLPYTATPVAEKKYYSDPRAKPGDPNKRVFEAYGNAAALFVHMGVYRGGPTTFAVVGLASKPIHVFGRPCADRIREWMAYHAWFFGPSSHFVFHDAGGVSPEVRAALEPWVRAGRATVQDIRDQAQFDGYYYNQFLVVNDCLHRYRHAANWTFFFDVDEYIYLPDGNTLKSVLNEFSNYTQFTIDQNPMSSVLCLNDSSQQYSRQWGFEKLLFRESRTGIRRDRKYAIQAKNAYATGVHMSENVIGKALHKKETKIRYYHYHNTITVHEELCGKFIPPSDKNNVTWFNKLPYVYDDNMKKLANTVKEFERKTIGDLHL
ncbi:Cysteine/Histidine-rich C1 domain family protein, putative isoform 1 [Hibiscus syriacus]|uniref:Glycosyltransferase family 92 protein n=1 Tax=Hibiscus syriacus TaxID=106335 RepID=A0A6A3BUQ7_HIBSY|nr:Cysteine/Histidine-rich C1 domain family protein, putative isoform 1 [Hibiscus syriacus]